MWMSKQFIVWIDVGSLTRFYVWCQIFRLWLIFYAQLTFYVLLLTICHFHNFHTTLRSKCMRLWTKQLGVYSNVRLFSRIMLVCSFCFLLSNFSDYIGTEPESIRNPIQCSYENILKKNSTFLDFICASSQVHVQCICIYENSIKPIRQSTFYIFVCLVAIFLFVFYMFFVLDWS